MSALHALFCADPIVGQSLALRPSLPPERALSSAFARFSDEECQEKKALGFVLQPAETSDGWMDGSWMDEWR